MRTVVARDTTTTGGRRSPPGGEDGAGSAGPGTPGSGSRQVVVVIGESTARGNGTPKTGLSPISSSSSRWWRRRESNPGRSLRDAGVREATGTLILAVVREGRITPSP